MMFQKIEFLQGGYPFRWKRVCSKIIDTAEFLFAFFFNDVCTVALPVLIIVPLV